MQDQAIVVSVVIRSSVKVFLIMGSRDYIIMVYLCHRITTH